MVTLVTPGRCGVVCVVLAGSRGHLMETPRPLLPLLSFVDVMWPTGLRLVTVGRVSQFQVCWISFDFGASGSYREVGVVLGLGWW